MRRFNELIIPLALLILTGMLTACAGLGPSSQVLPSSTGQAVSLDRVVSKVQEYDVYYSGPVFNPAAVLFIPEHGDAEIRLARGWKEVDGKEQLTDLLTRMRELRDPQIKLWALISGDKGRNEDILGYVYTAGNVSVRKDSESGSYTLYPVSERFNPRYYDADDGFAPRDH
ncbi:MAG: hypothetical protein U5L00_20990 [Desulfovermiculus sp.]|nr:hypothetical protein [Desulfovermiculus sp.]